MWRPWWHAIAYGLILGLANRILEMMLFDAPLLSLQGYVVDTTYIAQVKDGAYTLSGLPDGKYHVVAWTPFSNEVQTETIVLKGKAGKLDHLPLDRAQAGPPVRGVRVLPPAPLGVGHGLLERQPGAVLQSPVKTLVAQCSAGRGQVPLSSLPKHRESHEAERGPLLLGCSNEPDGALILSREQGDLSDHIEGVDNPRTPPVVREYLECVVRDRLSPLVVTLEQ